MSQVVDRWVGRLKGKVEPIGEMTHWERLEAAFRRRRTDFVPVAPELDYYQITHAGYTHPEILDDVAKTTDACLKTWADLRTDAIWAYFDKGHQLEPLIRPERRRDQFVRRGDKDYLLYKPLATTLDEAIALFEGKPWKEGFASSRAATHHGPHVADLLRFQEGMERTVPVIVGLAGPANQAETVVEVQRFVKWTVTEPAEKVRRYLELCLEERLDALEWHRQHVAGNGGRFLCVFGGGRTWGPKQLEQFGDFDRLFLEKASAVFPHVFYHFCGHNLPQAMSTISRWKGLEAVQYDMPYYGQTVSWGEWCESVAKVFLGKLCAMNSPTTQLACHGTPAAIKQSVREFIDSTLPYTTAVVMPGCEVDAYTPPENVRAMVEAARERRLA